MSGARGSCDCSAASIEAMVLLLLLLLVAVEAALVDDDGVTAM